MAEPKVENNLPFRVTVFKNEGLGTPAQTLPESNQLPRAAESTRLLGTVSVYWADSEYQIPILRRRTAGVSCGQEYNHNTLRIVSYDTIVASARAGLPYDDLVYPIDIVRDAQGHIIGCKGFGVVEDGQMEVRHKPSLTEEDIPRLSPPEEWNNRTNFPIKLYNPAIMGEGLHYDEIDPHTSPILELPVVQGQAIDLTPDYELDQARTEMFGAPIYRVHPGRVDNWPEADPDGRLQIVHGRAFRHAALMGGVSLRYCVTIGRRVRSNVPGQKTALGGRALYAPDLTPSR